MQYIARQSIVPGTRAHLPCSDLAAGVADTGSIDGDKNVSSSFVLVAGRAAACEQRWHDLLPARPSSRCRPARLHLKLSSGCGSHSAPATAPRGTADRNTKGATVKKNACAATLAKDAAKFKAKFEHHSAAEQMWVS